MKFSKKSIFSLIISFAIFLTIFSFVFADESDEKIKFDSAKASILEDFERDKAALEGAKKDFGLSDSESFSNATLSDAYPFYTISKDYLNTNTDSVFSFGGYILPIKVGDKATGIVVVREIDGILKIAEKTNNLTFEQDVKAVKGLVESNLSTKLIYDTYFHFYALAIQKGNECNIIPIKDNESYNIKKHQAKSFDLISEKLSNDYFERVNNPHMLGGNISDTNNKFPRNKIVFYIFVVVGITVLSIVSITFFKRLKPIQR